MLELRTLHPFRTVRPASSPITVVAMINVDQASTRATGCGAATAQWHTVFAVDANGKLNDHAEIVNGRRRYSGRMNSWTSHHRKHARQAGADRGDSVVVQRKPGDARRGRGNHQDR